jgi:amino acid transporter
LGFEQLVTMDIVLYGTSLVLEFVALVALRLREPDLPRPFRMPGGLAGAIIAGVLPTLLLIFAAINSQRETVLGMNGLAFGGLIILAGFGAYWGTARFRRPAMQEG